MSDQDDKDFFDRLGEIFNAPLPGTKAPQRSQQSGQVEAATVEEDPSLLERVKDILNTPLPGAGEAPGSPIGEDRQDSPQSAPVQDAPALPPTEAAPQPGRGESPVSQSGQTPALDEDDLDEQWWKREWGAFRAHQEQQRKGLEQKQSADLAKFSAYQDQEKHRLQAHQQQELSAFRQQQEQRLAAWKQAVAANPSSRPPPPPWGMPAPPGLMPPAGPPMGGPFPGPMGPPPWMQPRGGPRRRR